MQHLLPSRIEHISAEVHRIIQWLDIYQEESGMPNYVAEELRARLEHIEHLLNLP